MHDDPKCEACGERKSKHVETPRGPFTCPRVARGEGAYVYSGTWNSGVWCRTCHGPCDGHAMYRFVSVEQMTEAERKQHGFEVSHG